MFVVVILPIITFHERRYRLSSGLSRFPHPSLHSPPTAVGNVSLLRLRNNDLHKVLATDYRGINVAFFGSSGGECTITLTETQHVNWVTLLGVTVEGRSWDYLAIVC